MDGEHRARVTAAYRAWAESYDRLLRRTYSRVERALTRRHLLANLPERAGSVLLDLGGGDGRQSIGLLSAGRAGSAVILDLSADMLALAAHRVERARAAAVLVRADANRVPMAGGVFDVVLALGGVVCHCPDPRPALAEIRRVLRPGGRAAISVDNLSVGIRTACRERAPEDLRALLDGGAAPLFHHRPFPFSVRFFTPDGIRDAVREAGLSIVSMIGKPVFTWFSGPKEVLSGPEVPERVELEWPFAANPRFWPYADQLEVIAERPQG